MTKVSKLTVGKMSLQSGTSMCCVGEVQRLGSVSWV
jgi:hypothetical protein